MLNLYRLENEIETQMKERHIPGLALCIVQGQEVTYAKGFGVTSVEESGVPVTPQTLFRVGSTTKPMTGTAIMRLVEAGKLDLDKPVQTYLDWFTLPDEQAAKRITLRMLLSHTAGFPPGAEHYGARDVAGLERFAREDATRFKLVSKPGATLTYSNPGISLAGYIAEIAAGKPYPELMQELVFAPLQMEHTTFDPTIAMTYTLAQAHRLDKDGHVRVLHRFADNVAGYPAGFAISNVLDLANLAIMFLNEGQFQGQQVLSSQSVRQMQSVQANLLTIRETGYGLTFFMENYKGKRLVWHDGGINTYVSKFVLVPEDGIAIIMLFNNLGLDYEAITYSMLAQLLSLPAQEPEPQAIEPERALWPLFLGSYVGRWMGLASIQVVDEQLVLDLNSDTFPLQALRRDLYFGKRPDTDRFVSVGFLLDELDPVQNLYMDCFIMKREEVNLATPRDVSAWADYVGTYALPGFDTFIVRVQDDQLFIYSEEDHAEMKCIPLSDTRFACKWGVFDFRRDEQGIASILEFGDLRKFLRVPTCECKL